MEQLTWSAKASRNLGLSAHATFSGALAWPFFYPWPQRPAGLIDEAFKELGARWLPILQQFDEVGVDVCFELHPGEDLHDGVTFERFLGAVSDHPRANILYDPSHMILQQLDYLAFLDIYHERVRAFHVKDAEFHSTGRSGVYGGYQNWIDRPGRFRSLGDGQIDFKQIFTKMAQYDYPGWAVLGVGMLHPNILKRALQKAHPSSAITLSARNRPRLRRLRRAAAPLQKPTEKILGL